MKRIVVWRGWPMPWRRGWILGEISEETYNKLRRKYEE